MHRTIRLSLVAVMALATASLAHAQAGGGAPPLSYEAVMSAKEGAWADYSTQVKGRAEEVKVRYTLVEKTPKRMVLTIDTRAPIGPVQIRMQLDAVPPSGGGKDVEWKIAKMQMKLPTSPQPQEVPVPATAPTVKKGQGMGQLVGTSSVKTPVGTFDCKQYRVTPPPGTISGNFDVWISDKVAPVGLVKQADQSGTFTTVLSAVGTGTPPPLEAPAAPGAGATKQPAPAK